MTEPNVPGLPGLPDLGDLLSGLQKMQEAQTQEYEGVAGGGAVRVRATGSMEFTAVEIAPGAVDPDDVEMLQDLVLAALHDLAATISEAQRDAVGGMDLGDLGESLGGLFGGLGELGGPGGEP
ncbi:MAG: YbaB/EbfC family nucleoid-associated protein [Acidimicrobiales bacterium]